MYQTDTDENYIDMTNFNVEFFMLNDFEIPLVFEELKGVWHIDTAHSVYFTLTK